MRVLQSVVAGLGFTLACGVATAAVSQQEADELGKSLTPWGAEVAGNADKTIPAYTGGLPASTDPAGWKKGSGRWDVGPFDQEKPLYSITAANYDTYSKRLTPGTIAMLKKYPEFRVDVYPTHRSVSYDQSWLSHCKDNAQSAKLGGSGDAVEAAHSCVPFPIPKTGTEVMWNAALHNTFGVSSSLMLSFWLVDADSNVTDIGHVSLNYAYPYRDPAKNAGSTDYYTYELARWLGPSSQVGTKILTVFPMDWARNQQLSWVYTPGTRRTRLAPEFSYDTPIASNGGALNYDEPYGFAGQLDRYNFKLVGKKEIYIPYNAGRMMFASPDKMLAKRVFNPDVSRWELHRVWVVDATLKDGKRHSQPHRTFYVDEDTWAISAVDGFDQSSNLVRVQYDPIFPVWDAGTSAQGVLIYDLSKGTLYINSMSRPTDYVRSSDALGDMNQFTPAALTSSGVR
ncbi:DUF1329 domain-containing protein [Paraburkholderia bannensis]|uniref:DUF1329 domain-containing protein n=1 Tax=Paraburkholderia bannensis TaxID=765414 RepID=UPI002AB64B3E|nr:DUF1329 domain-containing protein [Paraburkholderia bannensis]